MHGVPLHPACPKVLRHACACLQNGNGHVKPLSSAQEGAMDSVLLLDRQSREQTAWPKCDVDACIDSNF
jgi:flagellar biosynthesis/type III secretory pathway ATPase